MTVSGAVALVVLAGALVAYGFFWFGTLDAIWKASLSSFERALWTLSILVFQFFGPLAWWLVGPGARQPEKAKAHLRYGALAVAALVLVVFLSGALGGGSEEIAAPEPVRIS